MDYKDREHEIFLHARAYGIPHAAKVFNKTQGEVSHITSYGSYGIYDFNTPDRENIIEHDIKTYVNEHKDKYGEPNPFNADNSKENSDDDDNDDLKPEPEFEDDSDESDEEDTDNSEDYIESEQMSDDTVNQGDDTESSEVISENTQENISEDEDVSEDVSETTSEETSEISQEIVQNTSEAEPESGFIQEPETKLDTQKPESEEKSEDNGYDEDAMKTQIAVFDDIQKEIAADIDNCNSQIKMFETHIENCEKNLRFLKERLNHFMICKSTYSSLLQMITKAEKDCEDAIEAHK